MLMLKEFILNLVKFSKPELKIRNAEWAEANIDHCQFIEGLSVLPWIPTPGELDFDLIVHVRLGISRNQNGVPNLLPIMKQHVKMELWFEKFSIAEVQSLCRFAHTLRSHTDIDFGSKISRRSPSQSCPQQCLQSQRQ
jgi:hypothetical protein